MIDSPPTLRWAHASVLHGVITPSAQTRDQLLGLGFIHPSRVRVIQNGVDVTALERLAVGKALLRLDLGLDPETKILLCVGRLSNHKGHVHLVRAMPMISARHPTTHLVLVGGGPREDFLRRITDEVGAQDCVTFLGERWDAVRLMQLADCFALPSLYEGMSTALLEAMACGLPVVATRVSGSPEVVTSGRTGLLVPPADPVALANAVNSIFDHPKEAARMGHRARQRIIKRHGFSAMVDKVEALLTRGWS